MNLTFKGFLRGYCRELTGLKTDNLKTMLNAVLTDAPAAEEALMCFAAVQGKASHLLDLAKGLRLEAPYREIVEALPSFSSVEEFLASETAPIRYNKVWQAFMAKKNRCVADRRVVSAMREKTLDALSRTHRTVYSLCKQLNLNRGNVYAYLNAGDVTKVSRDTARRLLDAAAADAPA